GLVNRDPGSGPYVHWEPIPQGMYRVSSPGRNAVATGRDTDSVPKLPHREDGSSGPGVGADLLHRVLHVVASGPLADRQLAGNVPVAQPTNQQAEHLDLARRQTVILKTGSRR